jgi:hypothetical protein
VQHTGLPLAFGRRRAQHESTGRLASLPCICSAGCDIGETRNKSLVVHEYTQKAYNFVLILCGWAFSPSFQYIRDGRYPLCLDNMP